MKINEKQIIELMEFLSLSLNGILSEAGRDRSYTLLDMIREQQSEELKEIQ